MTEEAKNEIEEMGEDVDDFVVRTKSKTDQIIRHYTSVASNMYKGVSVLDPKGNLRDTYSIYIVLTYRKLMCKFYNYIGESHYGGDTEERLGFISEIKNLESVETAGIVGNQRSEVMFPIVIYNENNIQSELAKYNKTQEIGRNDLSQYESTE